MCSCCCWQLELRDRDGRLLKEIEADMLGKQPLSLLPDRDTGPIPYPSYEVLIVDGQMDVVEDQRMERVFYITRESQNSS